MASLVGFLAALTTLGGLQEPQTIYDFEVQTMEPELETISLSKYKGNVTLIVNVASFWGLTPLNYKQLQQLNEKYYDQGLRILGFPCNQFANQEPGTDADIKEFVKQYGVTFDLFHKINVNGNDAIPLYKFLKAKCPGFLTNAIKWNFTKFLVDRNGVPQKRYAPNFAPNDITPDLVKMLAESATSE